jgi:hypothetical protein
LGSISPISDFHAQYEERYEKGYAVCQHYCKGIDDKTVNCPKENAENEYKVHWQAYVFCRFCLPGLYCLRQKRNCCKETRNKTKHFREKHKNNTLPEFLIVIGRPKVQLKPPALGRLKTTAGFPWQEANCKAAKQRHK